MVTEQPLKNAYREAYEFKDIIIPTSWKSKTESLDSLPKL